VEQNWCRKESLTVFRIADAVRNSSSLPLDAALETAEDFGPDIKLTRTQTT
jgi:hypothetical protein